MHPLHSLFPEDGHFGHLLVSIITLGIGIALTQSPFHIPILSHDFFFYYYYHFMGFIECSYLWLSFKWDTFGSHFSFFMIFALVFEARLYLFITLMARFWHSIQSRLPHPIILFKLWLKFSRWLLYLPLNPSKTGQKLFVFIQHLRVLNKLKT